MYQNDSNIYQRTRRAIRRLIKEEAKSYRKIKKKERKSIRITENKRNDILVVERDQVKELTLTSRVSPSIENQFKLFS